MSISITTMDEAREAVADNMAPAAILNEVESINSHRFVARGFASNGDHAQVNVWVGKIRFLKRWNREGGAGRWTTDAWSATYMANGGRTEYLGKLRRSTDTFDEVVKHLSWFIAQAHDAHARFCAHEDKTIAGLMNERADREQQLAELDALVAEVSA